MVSESRRRIELAACGLLAQHGYHGFGLKALSEAAGLPYGSIYHHFPGGKEEIAVAAITGTGTAAGRMIRQAPTDVFATTATLFDFMVGKLAGSEWDDGCPIGTPALDGASDVEAIRAACATAFDAMEQAFAGMLAELGLSAQDAGELATTVVAAYEGATMLARVRRSDAPLRTVAVAMERLIRVTFTEAGLPKMATGSTGTGSSDIDAGMPAVESAQPDVDASVVAAAAASTENIPEVVAEQQNPASSID
ncbi:TetR/AcrR family transcriptional regulator [Nocardia sp. CS682]|uniref:TetR/AcrR family transcriptional regulator n=1 Tax=Nocardia sp. CS682 TaxID=1047172 RepID=UPI001075408B|nr:TetR/AcrR family transcriptional regulator [Nocardia sp. CS682]QBS39885.1 TetR/AcrR family transcriptional regulator [Nocardia sp. CS682]